MTKGKSSSDQRSEVTKSDLLRTIIIPQLMALQKNAQQRRPQDVQGVRPDRLVQRPVRSIIIGPRPQQRPLQAINKSRADIYPGYKALFDQKVKKGYRTVCKKRDERREQLFAMGIAGSGRRRSPGQGGSYKRTEGSQISCKRVRR